MVVVGAVVVVVGTVDVVVEEVVDVVDVVDVDDVVVVGPPPPGGCGAQLTKARTDTTAAAHRPAFITELIASPQRRLERSIRHRCGGL